mmetsp:Transcript_16386/g.31035  ORF Transcript_16386/g.31035 Transcript_16386/m.31035 type:complete len:1026 (+) Transcript_16386:80-3157(+)|eukprot:CAMPEP_0176494644 /NCGR_PEP_ID=MMETSP0200_2-20121128/10217_1 /TAXON_ID=947934 /ORGANISM="Chaetoceros sp., Strain GSL56" /LENGTH=1025 /DNA_ID=CAMNT_0017892437 /DNA_START=120 /DNA_END=3197 /DNA_ORIENTATION=-
MMEPKEEMKRFPNNCSQCHQNVITTANVVTDAKRKRKRRRTKTNLLHSLLHATALTQLLYKHGTASSCTTRSSSTSSQWMRASNSVCFVTYSCIGAAAGAKTIISTTTTTSGSKIHDRSQGHADRKRYPLLVNRRSKRELLVPSVTSLYDPTSPTSSSSSRNRRQEKLYFANRNEYYLHHGHNTSNVDSWSSSILMNPLDDIEQDDYGHQDTYMKLRRDDDVKLRLTHAINEIWKMKRDSAERSDKSNSSVGHDRTVSRVGGIASDVDIQHDDRQKDNAHVPRKMTIRNLWKRRHARSIEEGIRRERTELATAETTEQQLSQFLDETTNVHLIDESGKEGKGGRKKGKRYAARTIAGLISALAEEATGLEVEVDARNDTPFWGKHIDTVKINFSRLGVKALRMGGLDEALLDVGETLAPYDKETIAESLREEVKKARVKNGATLINNQNISVDEIFDRIDIDNSGALDEEELALALSSASGLYSNQFDVGENSTAAFSILASRLISIYDANGDGVVDREEYKKLVKDMTSVRQNQRLKQKEREEKLQERSDQKWGIHPLKWVRMAFHTVHKWSTKDSEQALFDESTSITSDRRTMPSKKSEETVPLSQIEFEHASDISDDPSIINTISKSEGSIVLSDLKLDLRRLLFGAVPIVKHITPGGPLILEPFTVTLKGSFTREDILESALLDDGLRRLVARALRRRVRSLRDLLDGAVFYGRTWNMASKQAPVVEVPKLTNIEFDAQDRMIITGRAKVRTSPDQPFVENSFKLRTKLGTRENGHIIRLEDPELALVLECPKAWERNIVSACRNFKIPVPRKPEPLFQFIPLVSPIKKTEQDGFNLGEDNTIKSIYVKDNGLRFELSSVLRPGRFLGNHYLAFTVPNRTFIITMDRIREGIRTARQNKRRLERSKRDEEATKKKIDSELYNRAVAQALSSSIRINSDAEDADVRSYKEKQDDLSFIDPNKEADHDNTVDRNDIVSNRPGFFGRFLEGYLEAAREETERERNEHLATAISEFFSSTVEDVD